MASTLPRVEVLVSVVVEDVADLGRRAEAVFGEDLKEGDREAAVLKTGKIYKYEN